MWNPDPRIQYQGKYPTFELVKARQALIDALSDRKSVILERLKPKIGIPSAYGKPVPLLPPVHPPTGELGSSSDLSLADEVPSKKRRQTHTVTSSMDSSNYTSIENKSDDKNVVDLTESDPEEQQCSSKSEFGPASSFFIGNAASNVKRELLVDKLKCDFCSFAVNATDDFAMQAHLNKAQHFSASVYKMRTAFRKRRNRGCLCRKATSFKEQIL